MIGRYQCPLGLEMSSLAIFVPTYGVVVSSAANLLATNNKTRTVGKEGPAVFGTRCVVEDKMGKSSGEG
jgi:hypothetical protein